MAGPNDPGPNRIRPYPLATTAPRGSRKAGPQARAMSFLFGPSRRDQVHLLSTLQSLHTTSVAGLAAALSWSERKTEKVLREAIATSGGSVRYDPARRTVTVAPAQAVATNPSISGGHAAPPAPASVPAPTPSPAALLPKAFGGSARCARCGVPLLPTASGEGAVCPQCGQISTRRGVSAPANPRPPDAAPPPLPTPPDPENDRETIHAGDRRSQELFAAWVTARPIPCPRCRTTLQHRGVGEYGCPSCGHRVAFETSLGGVPRPPAAPVPAGPN
jgi:uncharacterized Zn finger protein (UPF0148 family)